MTLAEENNNGRTPKSSFRRIWDTAYDFVETYGLDFTSVIIAVLGLTLYEVSYISPEAIGRWTLLALLGISISNMGNRGAWLRDIQKKTEEGTNLIRQHLDKDVLEQNLSRAIDEHLGKVDKCNAVGITGIFEGFDAGEFRERSRTAKGLLGFWTLGQGRWTE